MGNKPSSKRARPTSMISRPNKAVNDLEVERMQTMSNGELTDAGGQ